MTKRPLSGPQNPEDPYTVTQASRIYFLPNLMTAGNLFCGFMAILECIQARLAETSATGDYGGSTSADHYRFAVWLIFGAAAFDALDGRLARIGGRESLFGAEFDSLADVISFGMAPALLMLYLIISPTQAQDYQWFRGIGWFIGFIYLLCAAMRLARFNVITNPYVRSGSKDSNRDFVGLPVPAAATTVAATVLFLLKLGDMDRDLKSWSLALPPLMLLVSVLMMSTVRYPSGKNLNMQTRTRLRPFVGFLIAVGLVVFYKEFATLGMCLAYIFFGLFRYVRRGRPGIEPTDTKRHAASS